MGLRIAHGAAWRALLGLVALTAILAFVLTSCPSNRDGMPGQLAAAKEETQSAARSAALALQLWSQGRSTRQLAAVQLADARDEVVKAYQGITVLKAENSVDLDRQSLLARSMTATVDTLNHANGAVRELPGHADAATLRQQLLAGADQLEHDYR